MIKLTRQQKKAVDYLVKGLTDKEIAHEMGLSISGVKLHLYAVRTKINIETGKRLNRLGMALYLLREGYEEK